jgi:hypothetical protein
MLALGRRGARRGRRKGALRMYCRGGGTNMPFEIPIRRRFFTGDNSSITATSVSFGR